MSSHFFSKKTSFYGAVFLLGSLAVFSRLFRIHTLPGEPWGDVNEHIEIAKYLKEIWFWTFYFGGDGPIFSYLFYAFSFLTGFTFFTEKVVTALVGIVAIIASYFFSLSLFPRKSLALITTFLTTVSFWTITFSRQGKPHILVTLFVMLVVLALRRKQFILSGFLIVLGMFSQAGIWGVIFFSFYHWKTTLTVASIAIVSLLIFSLTGNAPIHSTSFFQSKLVGGEQKSVGFIISRVSEDFVKNNIALFRKGDPVATHNIAHQAHLDEMSRVLFIIGIGFLIRQVYVSPKYWYFAFYIFLPFLFLQVPSVLDISNPDSSPNMGRTLVLTPFLFFTISWAIFSIWKRIHPKALQMFLCLGILIFIMGINFYRYFVSYPNQLPHQNTSFSMAIREFVEQLPPDKLVTMVGCCWSHSIPEPKSIQYNFDSSATLADTYFDENQQIFTDEDFNGKYPDFILLDPLNLDGLELLYAKYTVKNDFLIKKNNWDVVRVLEVQRGQLDSHL